MAYGGLLLKAVIKIRVSENSGNYLQAEEVSASHEGLRSMELII
jgi:hypothetical protein